MIYVWKNVLCDYTCGMIVIRADSIEEAHKIVKDNDDQPKWWSKNLSEEIADTDPDFTYLDGQNFFVYESGGG